MNASGMTATLGLVFTATGMVGGEGNPFLFTLRHSVFLTSIIRLIVFLQAYVFPSNSRTGQRGILQYTFSSTLSMKGGETS